MCFVADSKVFPEFAENKCPACRSLFDRAEAIIHQKMHGETSLGQGNSRVEPETDARPWRLCAASRAANAWANID
jgi:hypothetical protein